MSIDGIEWWDDIRKDIETSIEYKAESVAMDIAFQVYDRIKELRISQSELAGRLRVSRSYISQVLSGKPNMTVETLLKLAKAIEMELEISLRKPVSFKVVPREVVTRFGLADSFQQEVKEPSRMDENASESKTCFNSTMSEEVAI